MQMPCTRTRTRTTCKRALNPLEKALNVWPIPLSCHNYGNRGLVCTKECSDSHRYKAALYTKQLFLMQLLLFSWMNAFRLILVFSSFFFAPLFLQLRAHSRHWALFNDRSAGEAHIFIESVTFIWSVFKPSEHQDSGLLWPFWLRLTLCAAPTATNSWTRKYSPFCQNKNQ